MAVKALSYIGVNSDKFEDWSIYSQKYLGMQQIDRGKEILSFRMDDQKQRLTITGDKGDGLGFLGWEVETKEDLQTFANKLEENKIVNLILFFLFLTSSIKSLGFRSFKTISSIISITASFAPP